MNNIQKSTLPKWKTHDTQWTLSLFGTAVGAGILFLPMHMGANGFWPLLIIALLSGPMTYFAHRGLTRFILSSSKESGTLINVIDEHFGSDISFFISILYFFSIFSILLIYGVGLTNTFEYILEHQSTLPQIPRVILSGAILIFLFTIMLSQERIVLKAFSFTVYPLMLILFGLSLYLIPSWNMPQLSDIPSPASFSTILWLSFPVIIFAFSHAAAISVFSQAQRKHYKDNAMPHAERILKYTSLALVFFVLFFVFSCALSLSPEQLLKAREDNVSILSYLSTTHDNHFIVVLAPIVAIIAIASSFFGHFMGAKESLHDIVIKRTKFKSSDINKAGNIFMFFSLWLVAIINPSILSMIELISGPVIAMVLFILPMMAVYKVKSLKIYANHISTYFVLIIGFLTIAALGFELLTSS